MVYRDSYIDDYSMVEIAGNRLVWKHIQEENALVASIPSISEGLDEETRKMILNPLGYDAIKDIDEIHNRNRRKSDNPLINPTSEKMAYHFPKIEGSERR